VKPIRSNVSQMTEQGQGLHNHWLVVASVCIGAFMAALDASIVNVALPTIEHRFVLTLGEVAWVSLIYLLVLAALIVPLGRLSDMYGRKWMYTLGFGVFIFGSALCGFAMSFWFLLGARTIQGIGASMLQANSVSIITANTPSQHRGKAIGIQASAQGIGLSIGPTVGGLILSALSWRWVFFVNIPVGVAGTILGHMWLPQDKGEGRREHFDFLGGLFLVPAVVAVIYMLNVGFNNGVNWMVVVPCLIITGAFSTLLIVTEGRTRSPLLNLRLFKITTVSRGMVGGILSFAVMYAVIFLMPFYFERLQHLSTLQSGLYLSVIPLGMALSTPAAGVLTDGLGWRTPTILGMALTMSGSLALTATGGLLSGILLLGGLFFVGVGLGIYTPPNNASVMGSVPGNALGVTGGMLNMARTLGMSLGVTLGGFFYELFLYFQGRAQEATATGGQMLRAYHHSFLAVMILAAIPLLLSLLPGEKKRGTA